MIRWLSKPESPFSTLHTRFVLPLTRSDLMWTWSISNYNSRDQTWRQWTKIQWRQFGAFASPSWQSSIWILFFFWGLWWRQWWVLWPSGLERNTIVIHQSNVIHHSFPAIYKRDIIIYHGCKSRTPPLDDTVLERNLPGLSCSSPIMASHSWSSHVKFNIINLLSVRWKEMKEKK